MFFSPPLTCLLQMKGIIKHPFFNMNTPGVPPQIVNPSFHDAARIIPSEQHIDRNILENITTLYRKIPQDEIIARLLSEKRTWEKVFYFLLKEYHERQSEEYGHGMSFVDYTVGNGHTAMDMHRKMQPRFSAGPTGTIKVRSSDLSPSSRPTTPRPQHRQPSPAAAASHTKRSPHNGRSSPVATRPAPPSPGDDSPRRQRAVVGPRPNTTLKENTTSPPIPKSQPSEKQGTEEKAVPRRPDRNSARPVSVGAAAALLGTENTLSTQSNALPAPSPRARAHTVGAEKASTTFAVDAITPKNPETAPTVLLDKKPSREFKVIDTDVISNSALPHIETSTVDTAPVSPLIGLGLQLSSPPPLFAVPTSRPAPTSIKNHNDEQKVSSLVDHPATKRRPVSASLLTRTAMHPPQSPRANRARAETTSVVRDSGTKGFMGKSKRPPSLRLDQITKNMASYPSPPPSQASSLEPLLALQQSPVFSERFSLHLDAMMLKTPLPDPSPTELDAEDEDQCDSIDMDEGAREIESEVSTSLGSPVSAVLGVKRPRADTGATMTMGDWSFLAEADEARQAVPIQTPVAKHTAPTQLPRAPAAVHTPNPVLGGQQIRKKCESHGDVRRGAC